MVLVSLYSLISPLPPKESRETEGQLQEARRESRILGDRIKQLEQEVSDTKDHLKQANAKGKEFADKSWEQREQIQNQQQTISILVSEKASLTTSLDRLEELESGEIPAINFVVRKRN